MVGIDLGEHDPALRIGHRVTLEARRRGAIIRPLGETIVLMPPLSISEGDLRRLVEITGESIEAALASPADAGARRCRPSSSRRPPEPAYWPVMDREPARSRGVSQTLLATAADAPSEADVAFDSLYRSSRDDVYAYAAGLLRDVSAAEEVTATAFERAYRKRSRFDPDRGEPRAWLFGIARNAALDELRRRGRQAELTADPIDVASAAAGETVEQSERRLALADALGRRSAAPSASWSRSSSSPGSPTPRSPAVLGISESNAGTRLHRAMTKLREACDGARIGTTPISPLRCGRCGPRRAPSSPPSSTPGSPRASRAQAPGPRGRLATSLERLRAVPPAAAAGARRAPSPSPRSSSPPRWSPPPETDSEAQRRRHRRRPAASRTRGGVILSAQRRKRRTAAPDGEAVGGRHAGSGIRARATTELRNRRPARSTEPARSGPYASQTGNRDIERSAQIVLGAEPAEVRDDAAQVFEAVHAAHGIVLNSSIRDGAAGEAGARFELLIPAAKLERRAGLLLRDRRRRLPARVDRRTSPRRRSASTERLEDSDARVHSLLDQLAGAESDSERAAVEAELRAERRHQAALRSRLSDLHRRANLSRVSLRIETGAHSAGEALPAPGASATASTTPGGSSPSPPGSSSSASRSSRHSR